MTGTALPIAPAPLTEAQHGQWCPKMCTFACPVAAATGRDDAVPWSFHREVADLAAGRVVAPTLDRLVLCNGCLACRDACTYEQDVPEQVVAARTALVEHGTRPAVADGFLGQLDAGTTDDGSMLPALPEPDPGATTVVVVGRGEPAEGLQALRTLADRIGRPTRFVRGRGAATPQLAALGLATEARAAAADLATDVADARLVVVADPDLLPSVRTAAPDRDVVDLPSWLLDALDAGHLAPDPDDGSPAATVHDAPATVRRGGAPEATREVLARLGIAVVEAEAPGTSAGPGLALELLAPDVVAAVAARRASQLSATTATTVVGHGPAEIHALRSAGLAIEDLAVLTVTRTLATPTATPSPQDDR